ncbi:uncharacterized protein YndB with AHSA1/START domain [Nonomuraea muscovyensis]|uniref:Uncharacterized protein YndB with AHSA1/START domain n=1 Tax=Nonomuraea muscovyensis TaxID=1124761 RepID=A0A7X0EWP0_9ACTN|nr:uncharacterized protein YndB with AHSA1/START domain [Nonomuraea muscovyensis]
MILNHSGLPDQHAAAELREGWGLCLDNLDQVIAP